LSAEELIRFLDDGDWSSESNELRTHLDSCTQCQTLLEALTAANWIPASDSQSGLGSDPELQRWMERLKQSLSEARPSHTRPSTEKLDQLDSGMNLGHFGEFRILQRLAGGAQGTLYLARDERLHRNVAIKILHLGAFSVEGNRKRFEREARLAAGLNDERIVRVYQVVQEPDFPPFIVMEYVAGCSLKQRLEIARPTIDEAVDWVYDAALGLSVAHQAGLIHRDIKPSNLMLDEKSGLTRLTDFGLALEQADANRMTQEGVLAGTPAYISPEQLLRPEAIDHRTDIYSLGVVFYELMAGEVPFRGTLRMTLLQVAHEEPRSPRQLNDQIPVDLETIVLKAMARDPNQRFASAQDFADELARWRQGLPILSRPTGRWERIWRWCRRRPAVAALSASTIGLFLILAVVMGVSYFRLERSARQKQLAAETAEQQRDAALEVLSQLIFQLQAQFEPQVVDLDHVQKNSLQIAIDGLHRLRQLTDQTPFPEALTAEAFRKMGDTLRRLEQYDEARNCLVRAERGFRQLQLRPENRQQALEGIVETLWSRHDLELDAGLEGEALIDWLRTATEAARKLHELAPCETTQLRLAQALVHEVQADFDHAEVGQVVPGLEGKLTEAQRLLENNGAALSFEKNPERDRLWTQSVVLGARYQIELAEYELARQQLTQALSRLRPYNRSADMLSPIRSHVLTLEYLLHAVLMDSDLNEQAEELLKHIEQELGQLKAQVANDSDQLKAGLEFLQELADRFEEDQDESGRLFFLNQVQGLLEVWLARVPGDEFASLKRACCKCEVAETKLLLDYPKQQVREAFREAIADYRKLSARAFFDEEQWYDYCDLLLTAAEYEQLTGGKELAAFANEARRVRAKLSEFFFPGGFAESIDERLKDLGTE
jgi:serine/threonine protein kinase